MTVGDSASSPAKPRLYYKVEDVPPWSTALLFGLQQVMVCASGVITMPLIIADLICAKYDPLARVKLIATQMVITGFSTILQTLVGVGLPLLQGPSGSFLAPIIILMSMPKYRCPTISEFDSLANNRTLEVEDAEELWMSRMRVIQGGLITASLVQIGLGAFGLVGILRRCIGPLTIASFMISLELSLTDVIVQYCSKHWTSVLTLLLVLLFAFYLGHISVPVCSYHQRKCSWKGFPIFSLFPYILAIAIGWLLCIIFTETRVFNLHNDYYARTDNASHVIADAPWVRFPYPCQWGVPELNVASFIGMLAGTIGVIVESIGDYIAAARVCCVPAPPPHVMNRGLFVEGICCFIGGFLGSGSSVTTYSENLGVIGITKAASRATMVLAGIIFLVLGVFTKVGAVLSTIPDPILGAVLVTSLSIVGGIGLSGLHLADMQMARNISIVGLAVMLGVLVPKWVNQNNVSTGVAQLDQVLQIILSTGMIISGLSAVFMDNTFPGATLEQRGIRLQVDDADTGDCLSCSTTVYEFPKPVMAVLNRIACCKFVPFMPTFDERAFECCKRIRCRRNRRISDISNGVVPSDKAPTGASPEKHSEEVV